MKYKYLRPFVNVNRSEDGTYIITDPTGHINTYTEEELARHFRPVVQTFDKDQEIRKLALSIADLETLVDDDNAEELLSQACEIARKIFGII